MNQDNAIRRFGCALAAGVLAVGLGWLAPLAQASPSTNPDDHPFDLTHGGGWWALGSAVVVVVVVWLLVMMKRRHMDEQYADITPGRVPPPGAAVKTIHAKVRDVPVADRPPERIPLRLAGCVVRESASSVEDGTAMIIDLAVRGFLTIHEDARGEFTLTRTDADPAGLDLVERQIYDGLFANGPLVRGGKLAEQGFGEWLMEGLTQIDQEVADRKWWKTNAAADWLLPLAIALAFLGFCLTIPCIILEFGSGGVVGSGRGFGWPCAAMLLIGIIMFVLVREGGTRTADGSAATIECVGFKLYLETVEAHQIRLMPGQDIFSAYLPYAISFDCVNRWATLFAELATSKAVHQPTWYSREDQDAPIWIQISEFVDSLTGTLAESLIGCDEEDDEEYDE